ncbi:VHL beta domain-containing protein [Prosthecodimorpha staleyi]|uniref:von Hippel-Lindau disease tumour suppressor beta domain-containing protein n=1 Tax=Prosthecodimorpha staleyi TaxID=2840188 RepID=A0A947D1C4_9HYPH|nr:hypothetical protein [Prosthecodimorpha staleyi]MBT9289138.1 hypothetical protein [Prosthecodimorpha staleyi]
MSLGKIACASLALLAGLSIMSSAAADEIAYDKRGRWSIAAVTAPAGFDYCTADIDNGKVQLRLATDGRSWQVGVPYYGRKGKVEAYFGFGAAAEVANFNADGQGWAMMAIDKDQIDAFRSNPSFSINLDRGEQTWTLAGAAAAIDLARECVRNRGQKQVAAAPAIPAPPAASGKGCPPPGRYRSQNSNVAVNVLFYNGTKIPLNIYWIDFNGGWKKYHTLRPDSNVRQKTFATHPWIAVDQRGNCHGSVMMPDPKDQSDGPNEFQIWD